MTAFPLLVRLMLAATLATTTVPASAASVRHLRADWTAYQPGSQAHVRAEFFIDVTSPLPEITTEPSLLPMTYLQGFSMTVTGTSGGDGTWGAEDFEGFYFSSPSPLDFSRELVGQVLENGCLWGPQDGPCFEDASLPGWFTFAGLSQSAPTASQIFSLFINGRNDQVILASLRPIPLPASLPLACGALALLAFVRRRSSPDVP